MKHLYLALLVLMTAACTAPAPSPAPPGSPKVDVSLGEQPVAALPVSQAVPVYPVPAGGLDFQRLPGDGSFVIPVPAWNDGSFGDPAASCPTGTLKYPAHLSVGEGGGGHGMRGIAYADIDADGPHETVVILGCYLPDGAEERPKQVIVIRQDGPRAALAGQIVSTANGVYDILSVEGHTDGTIRVLVRSRSGQEQWRTYAWRAGKFVQTAGTAEFRSPATDVDLVVTAAKPVFGETIDGVRKATVTVVIRNNGAVAAEHFLLRFGHWLPTAQFADTGWSTYEPELVDPFFNANHRAGDRLLMSSRWFGRLEPGQERRMEIVVTTTEAAPRRASLDFGAEPYFTNGDKAADTAPEDNFTATSLT